MVFTSDHTKKARSMSIGSQGSIPRIERLYLWFQRRSYLPGRSSFFYFDFRVVKDLKSMRALNLPPMLSMKIVPVDSGDEVEDTPAVETPESTEEKDRLPEDSETARRALLAVSESSGSRSFSSVDSGVSTAGVSSTSSPESTGTIFIDSIGGRLSALIDFRSFTTLKSK